MVLDVKGFPEKDLSVKVTEDNTLVIKGSTVKKTNSTISKKSFKHQFNISSSDLDQVTSALSSDGILTVIAPKKVSNIIII